MTASASATLYAGCAAVCLLWAILVLLAGRNRYALVHAAAPASAALWAGAVALAPEDALQGLPGSLEILRNLAWFGLLLALAHRTGRGQASALIRRFALVGGALGLLAFVAGLPDAVPDLPSLGSPALLARLSLALLVVLLAENLYRNADEAARWYVNLPCIALGSLAAFDILLYADAALSREFSASLLDARAAVTALAMPLLAIAAMRDRRWGHDPPVSREVVFHGATLVIAGAFLLGVGAVGETLQHLDAGWGRAAQISLLAGAVMAVAVAITSGSARSRVRRLIVDHFFRARYDYRREWLRCVGTLSAAETDAEPHVRAIRAIADPVDSPAGVLLLRDHGEAGLRWAGSWNLPARSQPLAPDHPVLASLRDGNWVAEFGPRATVGNPEARPAPADLVATYGPLWLAVPLSHHREKLLGLVLLAPPRAPFRLDGEVFDLLRTLGREVALFLAERRAAEHLADQRKLQDYAKRFAFVAHDVKTVASQLTLLLANAEHHLHDPEFQRDMLVTVGSATTRIRTLIVRLGQPGDEPAEAAPPGLTGLGMPGPDPTAPDPTGTDTTGPDRNSLGAADLLARLQAMAAARPGLVDVQAEGPLHAPVAMAPDRLDAAVTHLLNNAIEASRPGDPVRVRVRQEAGRLVVDIIDRGEGMTPEFIRDELFRPLSTSKPGGSGIGAWQARDLLRAAGGELTVLSAVGAGTTMRLALPLRAHPLPAGDPARAPIPAPVTAHLGSAAP